MFTCISHNGISTIDIIMYMHIHEYLIITAHTSNFVLHLPLECLVHGFRATDQTQHLLTPPTTLALDNDGSLTRCVGTWLAHMARITTFMATEFPLEGTALLETFKRECWRDSHLCDRFSCTYVCCRVEFCHMGYHKRHQPSDKGCCVLSVEENAYRFLCVVIFELRNEEGRRER